MFVAFHNLYNNDINFDYTIIERKSLSVNFDWYFCSWRPIHTLPIIEILYPKIVKFAHLLAFGDHGMIDLKLTNLKKKKYKPIFAIKIIIRATSHWGTQSLCKLHQCRPISHCWTLINFDNCIKTNLPILNCAHSIQQLNHLITPIHYIATKQFPNQQYYLSFCLLISYFIMCAVQCGSIL